MKAKKLLSVISLVLAFLIAFNSTAVAMDSAADYLNEVVLSNSEKTEEFNYPEAVPPDVDEKTVSNSSELRLPDVQSSISTEELEYGKPVDVDTYTKTYQTGKESFKTVYSEFPNTYKNMWGKEIEYDNTLVLKEKLIGADYYTNTASDIKVKFPSEVKSNFGIHFEYDGVEVKLTPKEGNFEKVAAKENAVLYNDVFDGIDIQYTVNALGLKEDIIFNKYVDKNVFSYELKVSGADTKVENGVLKLYEKNSDKLLLSVSAPVMTDANGNYSENVSLSLSDDILTVTADKEWLADPERAYPIKIDPNITVPASKIDVVTVSEYHKQYASKAYGYVGNLTASQIGVPGAMDLGRSRMYFKINDDFSGIPEGSKINSASLRIYQYTKIGSGQIGCYRVEDPYDIKTLDYEKAITLNESIAGESGFSESKVDFHEFDIRQTVNDWIQGIAPNYGLAVKAVDEYLPIGAFFTPYSSASNGGQSNFTPDKAPQIIIDWEIPNPVDPNYPLDNTTIDLRTIIETNKDGLLRFHGIFADGIAQPNASVYYALNDASKENQRNTVIASPSYKYPDSTAFNQYFPPRATKYKDILSNWQTVVPFTNPDFNTIYQYSATASKDGTTGNTAKSDEFLIYKIKQFDTLPKIANYYGVPLSQISFDNRVQDMLLLENNTIIVRNPSKNGNRPYNPEPLSDKDKRKIDSLLMGRGKHCEFGFEPVNLNTGNFYMNQTDISIPDFNGDFSIERTYNSKNAGYNSIFGRGWQFAYSESLTKTENGEFVYFRGDGSSIYFTPDGKGGYTCPAGYYLDFTPVKVDTKEGDFGGETLESYDVFEYEIKDASGTVKRFNYMGLLVKITDSKNFTTEFSYDDNYNLASITSPAGISYHFAYTGDGMVNAITLPNGKQLTYEYDKNNNLVAFSDGAGNKTTYQYDDKHQMVSWSDANGDVVNRNEYDGEGRVTKQTDGNGNVSLFAYGDHTTTTTDANGNKTVYYYDDNYRTTKIEYANGSYEEKLYDENNNLAAVIDRNGIRTDYEYDVNGNLIKEIRFDGAVKTYEYNSSNHLTKETDFDGKITQYQYNDNGDLVLQINNDGTQLSFEFDGSHRMTKRTDAKGYVTTYTYEGAWLSSITNPDETVSQYKYNSMGQVVSVIDASNGITRYIYDAAGRKITEQTADGAETKYVFDKAGDVLSTTDPNGNVYSFTYDPLGNILTATDPYGLVTSFVYDGVGNKVSETDSNGHTTTYTFDAMSNLTSVTDADGYTISYGYDKAGNKTKETDANGNETVFEYDYRFDKVSKITNALAESIENKFDLVGNLTEQIFANGSSAFYTYDSMNRVKSETSLTGLTTEYTYDNNGNIVSAKDNAGRNYSHEYDSMNRITKTVLPDGNENTFDYDALGRLISKTDAMGGVFSYTYDSVGNVLSATDSIGRTTKYEYDLNGNITKITAPNGAITVYEYNAYDLVTKLTDALNNHTTYTYDGAENLLTETDVYGNSIKYTYNGRNIVSDVKDVLDNHSTIEYDGNQNKTAVIDARGNKTVYEYDAEDRLIKATSPEGFIVSYEYNSFGQISCEYDNAGSKNTYTYDAAGRLICITDALGNTTEYTYDLLDNITAIKTADGNTTKYTYDVMGNVTQTEDAEGKVTNYTYDANGNLLTKEDYAQRIWQYNYDEIGRLKKALNPLNEGTEYTYNELDLLTSVKNANNNYSYNEYDILGNLISKTDENGNKTSYTYDSLYRVINTTAPDNGVQEYLYDAAGQLIKHKDALSNITKYSYDANGNLISLVTPNNGTYSYGYNKDNYQTSVTDPLGNVTNSKYDLAGRLTEKLLANGALYTYSYDKIGRVVGQTAPEGLSRTYVYDKFGNLASETDQSDRTTTYAYDIMHRLTTSTNAKGAATTLTYDKRGNLATVITPKGYKTSYEYDILDRINKSLDPVGRTEEYTYDPLGNVTKITKNGGRAYSYSYDNVGNLLSITNPMEQTQNFTYDSMNRLLSETDLAGKVQSYTYDLNGQMTSITNKLGGLSTFTYDGNGNMLSVTDAEKRTISYTYDLADNLKTVTEADIVVAEYEYDSVGNLIAYKDGNGKVTNYTYNQLGNMTSMTDPLGNVKEFSYNVNAMLETVTNPDKTTVHYDYDVLDQLISKSYDEETDLQALYGYDADGNRITMDDVAGTTNYAYDEIGRITAVTLSTGDKILYTYDEFGNLAKLTYPDNTSVSYTYNELNQLTQIKDRQNKVTTYERDANGNVIKVKRPNSTYSTIERNEMGQIVKIVNMGKDPYYGIEKELSKFEYTYDLSGFIKSEIATNGKTTVTNLYTYDARAQLVGNATITKVDGEITENVNVVYTYDNAGNRLTSVKTSGESTICDIKYTYNENNQMTDIEGNCDDDNKFKHVVLSYDVNGNLVKTACNETEKVQDYTYDNENRLKAVHENGALLMAALYDGDGERIFRVDYRKNPEYVSNKGGTAENIYYNYSSSGIDYDHTMIRDEMLIPNGVDAKNSINYELTGYINDINSEYTQVLMEYGANQSITNIYEYGDQRNSATINGQKGYYLYDGRGSVASLTGNSGGNMIQYTYDAYGVTTKTNNTLNNPYQYNAEYTDSSTGNQYLRARYYDAANGRFLTKDTYLGTVESPLSRNLYTYVRNNPLNLIDPSGYFFEQIFGVGAGAGRAVWDGVGGLFTGKGFSGFESGWNAGYKAGSDVGRKWDNAVIEFFGGTPKLTKEEANEAGETGKNLITKKEEIDKNIYNLLENATGNKPNNSKLKQQIEELMRRRKELCESLEKIDKSLITYNQNNPDELVDNPFSTTYIPFEFTREDEKRYDNNLREQVHNLLLSDEYSRSVWDSSSVEERQTTLSNFLVDLNNTMGLNVNEHINFLSLEKPTTRGSYRDFDRSVTINIDYLERDDSYEIMQTMIHEMRHAYQHQAIRTPELYIVSKETLEQWDNNNKHYISYNGKDNYPEYVQQAIEWDAKNFAKQYSDIKKYTGEYAGSW